ncbi:MAG: S8 family serine peptidase [Verrucomicrobia bacterium]|nr:S8 family serine peptidase [Verrucomicrobiota bacterium]
MRWRSLIWFAVSLLCLAGARYFWGVGERWAAERQPPPVDSSPAGAEAAPGRVPGMRSSGPVSLATAPQFVLLSAGMTAAAPPAKPDPLAYRLNNTGRKLEELLRVERALILENALIDTERPVRFSIPEHLQAVPEPGSYLVQARGPVDEAFRAALARVGASIVSYIPNNAFLVRISEAGAEAMRAHPRAAAVLAWEPYYKLKGPLLGLGVRNEPLPEGALLNLVVFADAQEATRAALEQLAMPLLAESPSPFGPVWTVRPEATGWTELARLPGVQLVEWQRERVSANDLSRVRLGVAADTVSLTNYLGLTGSNVLVNVNDTGVSANHPDLTGRVFGDFPVSLVDSNGHGTHVAGIIAGNGASSTSPVNVGAAASGSVTNADFRGKAPAARIFSMATGLGGPLPTDAYLQEQAARTNAFISNNSWHYGNDNTYGIGAASYDAATRDALPGVPGSQPLLFVFPAGNGARGNNSGLSGDPETVLSPGTAKNVITVGALEQPRDITNEVWKCTPCATCTNGISCTTNTPWRALTSSATEVAAYSGRGNVGMGIEGDFGRFKPDVVAPGTFVVSTRSQEWDAAAYYNPTSHITGAFTDLVIATNRAFTNLIFIPDNAVAFTVRVAPNRDSPSPMPDLPIFVRQDAPPWTLDPVATNVFTVPGPQLPTLDPVGATWYYTVANITTQDLSLDIFTDIVVTNDQGNYYEVLSNLNQTLGPYYRYETGTSMAAAAAAGTLALMQEYFETRLRVTNSPALYKALLINGARSVSSLYDFQVRSEINFQGWGLIQLTNSLPTSLTNGVTRAGPAAMHVFDQSPTNALATGERQTRRVRVSETAQGLGLPLRVTLVWTDPPGNPAAGVKLVNNLDLVVTNLDTGDVYWGNDIVAGNNFTFPWDTNGAPNADVVNNVENVYLLPPLATNYAITVLGRQVNVNAVTAHTNNVAQDYALVIGYGNGETPGALTLTEEPLVRANQWTLTGITNEFRSSLIEGQLLLGQHVGANTPLLGVTNGMTNQWHFYVVSNTMGFSNAAFVTSLPPTLSLPRMGVRENNVNNATRGEADIDLYVSKDPGLTNLVPAVLAAADQSRGRAGTELIVYSNSVAGDVYYIGVKAEDQMAAEYAFLAVFSLDPFSARDGLGNLIVRGLPIPTVVPDGSPADPGVALVLGLAVEPVFLRRVVVTNSYYHENPGDLLGVLSHGDRFAVLNNHRGDPPGQYGYWYDDLGEGDIFGAISTDGPGSLRDFVGEQGLGVWLLAMTDNSLTATGEVRQLLLRLEPQNLEDDGTVRTVPPNRFTFDFIDVPVAATNLTVCVASNTEPVELYLRRGDFPSRTQYDHLAVIPPGGGCLSVDKSDLPPLRSGRYYIGVFNPSAVAQTILLTAKVDLDPNLIVPVNYRSVGNELFLDDAVSYSSIWVTNIPNPTRIAQIEMGLRVDHPRISDLSFHLISPRGTRVLLMENRGNTNSISAGSSVLLTNVTVQETGFETALAGTYTPGLAVEDWIVTSNLVTVLQDPLLAHTGARMLSLRSGGIERSFSTTPGAQCILSFAYRRAPTLDGLVSWWPAQNNANDVADGNNGTLVGNTTYGVGRVGQAFVFDGDSDGVNVGNPANLQLQDLSIEGWIKRTSATVPSFNGNGNGTVFALGTGSLGGPGGYNFYVKANAQLAFGKSQAGEVVSGAIVADTNWHHVAVTKAGNTVTFYVDGVAYPASSPYNFGAFTFTAPGYVGAWQNNSGLVDNTFYGAIDELSVFNRALSPVEVQAIFAAAAGKCGLTIPPTNCVSFAAQVVADGITTNITALTTNWITNAISFTASQSNTFAAFSALGGNSGVLLDTISLRQTIIVTQDFYLTFTENTNRTSTPIKFAAPPFASASVATNFLLSGFEPAAAGDYFTPDVVDGWDVLSTNRVTVLDDPLSAHTGTKSLALLRGEMGRNLPTTAGRGYRLDLAYRAVTNLDPVSWWPGDLHANDIVDGNHGTLRNNTTYGPGVVGQAFVFDGVTDGVVVGNPTNLHLQNFTLEAWVKRASDSVVSFDQALGPGGDIIAAGNGGYGFALVDDGRMFLGVVGVSAVFSNQRVTDTNWHHLAVTKSGGTVVFYVDGVGSVAAPYNPSFSFVSPIGIGARGDNQANSLYGSIDEPAIYNRPLSATEIREIYAAGAAGKCGTVTPPSVCATSGAQVFVPGVVTNTFSGTTNWLTNSLAFTASASGTPVGLAPLPGGQAGVLLDTFVLHELPGSVYYLPEENLDVLLGENAYGQWRLEMWDTRTGATNLASLVSWQLEFVFQTDLPLPGVLTHGEAVTNSIPPGLIAYYIVDVPIWAQFATNSLLFANPPPGVNLLFNQNTPPTYGATNAGDFVLIGNSTGPASYTLSTNAVPPPPLRPGQRYYLGVENLTGSVVTYALRVDFDLAAVITLTNGVPYFQNNPGTGSAADYYRYVVSGGAQRAQFEINGPTGDMTLVARKGLPLPTLAQFDYLSGRPNLNDELIVVLGDSVPVALSPGEWFLTAVNISGGPADYAIKATEWPVTGRPIAVTAVSLITNSFCVTWDSLPGVHYYLEGTTDLSGGAWVIASPTLTATGGATTYCVPLPSPLHFFRVREGIVPLP